tara:strand:- start:45745 stop:45876 length:132 start_codon:yes stop_codon:yes gene_type:complete
MILIKYLIVAIEEINNKTKPPTTMELSLELIVYGRINPIKAIQ